MSSKLKVVYRLGGQYRAASIRTAVKILHEQANKALYRLNSAWAEDSSRGKAPEATPKIGVNKIQYLTDAVNWLNTNYNTGNKVVVFRLRRGHRGDKAEYCKFLRVHGLLAARPVRLVKKKPLLDARWVVPGGNLRQADVADAVALLNAQEGIGHAGNAPAGAGRQPRPVGYVARPRARQARPVG